METAIEVRGLVKTYPRGIRALDGLSFTVPAGILFALLGPNGAGKSTTVKILTTLSRADEGSAQVAGLDVRRHPDRVRRVIGVVGQKASADPNATGKENLALQGRVYGLRRRALADRIDELLDQLELSRAAGRLVRTYSGGMKRRLDIAMGLIHRPEVLFLDEPTVGLDTEIRAQIWEDLAKLVHQDGITILVTTHYLEEADRLASQLAIVDDGKVVVTGTPSGLKDGLRGDSLYINLSESVVAGEVGRALGGLRSIGEFTANGRSLCVRTSNGANAIPAVLAALDGYGVGVSSVTMERPSLDDVYFNYTGKKLSA
ncbi:daunorubicin resistance protein DrrA family ABC transporter ATP-binding protein [Acrocarpospora corrugata]|uniref:Daunorubicin resistance protein DrrA family ABC transporter ATP-binding protein n=1 Tax=Acrocarpospora corrugata TaxID=35763 RepID=A0A5M3W334_9ACTN|nr:ATP-binding cassette domain-containing protein [Acrocarpospora corrugata]GES03174.1 daunorubicin resistance protein DrrA family ABC transporter ATP-binding protein [Acrocarpospora corrugata]